MEDLRLDRISLLTTLNLDSTSLMKSSIEVVSSLTASWTSVGDAEVEVVPLGCGRDCVDDFSMELEEGVLMGADVDAVPVGVWKKVPLGILRDRGRK